MPGSRSSVHRCNPCHRRDDPSRLEPAATLRKPASARRDGDRVLEIEVLRAAGPVAPPFSRWRSASGDGAFLRSIAPVLPPSSRLRLVPVSSKGAMIGANRGAAPGAPSGTAPVVTTAAALATRGHEAERATIAPPAVGSPARTAAASAGAPDLGTIIDWKSAKSTWHCHWFPMKETRPNGGDPFNNLYAPGGILAKYDQAFGRASQAYELQHHFRSIDSTAADAGWAGHCNNAAEIVCLLDPPRRAVTVNGVTFSPHEISGLLVEMSETIATRLDFRGARYNGPSDDPNDPSPALVLDALEDWTKEDLPFVIDIERTQAVWNYPYDQVKVVAAAKPPEGCDAASPGPDGRVPPTPGTTTFYTFQFSGTGYDRGIEDERRSYVGWINRSPPGERTSGWMFGPDRKINPDFMWRPHLDESGWSGVSKLNPEIRGADVLEIYKASLAPG